MCHFNPLEFLDHTGKHLFVLGTQERIELLHYDSSSQRLTPFLRGISAGELEVSPDGQWVAYTTYPESTLWRSRLDGSERLQSTFAPINAHEPRWSPDGKQILFTDVPFKICVVSADGGTPRRLMPEDRTNLIGAGAWLPDGNSIIFVRVMGCPSSDVSCFRNTASIYQLDLTSEQVFKLPGSDEMMATRVSRDGHYQTAIPTNQNKVMLYDFGPNDGRSLLKALPQSLGRITATSRFGGVAYGPKPLFFEPLY